MDDRTLAFTPAWKQRDMIRAREVSPVELVELYLRRIDSLNPQLNAYLTVVGDMAMSAGRRRRKRRSCGATTSPPFTAFPSPSRT